MGLARGLAVALLAFVTSAGGEAWARVVPEASLAASDEHRRATGLIVHLMSNYHYLKAPLDDDLSQTIFERYIDSLDPNRAVFYAQDIEHFARYRTRLDDFLRSGYLRPAFDVYKTFRRRMAERAEVAQALLERGFDYGIDESYDLERKDAAWPETRAAMDELWRKRVKNDLLTLLLAHKSEAEAAETLRKRYQRLADRAAQLDADDIYQLFINAYTTAVEPHTAYFSPRTSENFRIRMSLSLEGIGAALQTEDEYTVVRRIIPGGPAEKSDRLEIDDRIIGVGQGADGEIVDVVSWRLEDVVDLIRGPKGTTVRLRVLPQAATPGSPGKVITLVRNRIELAEQAATRSIVEVGAEGGSARIGVIDIPTFYLDIAAMNAGEDDYRSTTRDVRRLLRELEAEGVEGVVIDLRGNGGGSLLEATELTGLFIESGPVVQVRDAGGDLEITDDPDPGIVYRGPLAVLVDRQSASASEIFAGAIQDYGRGVIVGEPTYGKGTVQNIIDLNRFVAGNVGKLGQLKVTIAQFFRVNGASTQHRGVVPDIVFPTAIDSESHGERALENSLPWTAVEAVIRHPGGDLQAAIDFAATRHRQRIETDPAFRYLLEEARARQEMDNIDVVSLLEPQRRQEFEAREGAREARNERFREAFGQEPPGLSDADDDPAGAEDDGAANPADVLLSETARILGDVAAALRHDGTTLRAEVVTTSPTAE